MSAVLGNPVVVPPQAFPYGTETVRSLIDAWADAAATDVFLIDPERGERLTVGTLRDRGRELHGCFEALGIAADEKVAFLLDNGSWTVSLFLGAMYAGRTVVALNAVAGSDALRYVLAHSDARALFVSAAYAERYPELLAQCDPDVLVIPTDESDGPEWPVRVSGSGALPALTPDSDGLLIYTSGTTGRPKGVRMTHRNVIAGGWNVTVAHELQARDRALCVLPLYHINGEMVTVMAPLVSRGSVVMPRRFSASRFWGWVVDHGCTWFSVVPTIIAYLLEAGERNPATIPPTAALRGVRFGRSASAPLSPDVHRAFERLFGLPIIETMGLTETAAQILSNPPPPAAPTYGSPGRGYGNEVGIVDAQGREVPVGEAGELIIRGPNVTPGYYKNPEATAQALTADGWLRPGDLACRDADGNIFITGRLKELIIKGGENIAPREIDEALYQHPAVLEAAAFPVDCANYGQEIEAGVALKTGAETSEAELRDFCEKRLGQYKTPRRIHLLPDLPKGPSGKIQRLKLAELVASDAGL